MRGKAYSGGTVQEAGEDHPRLCGEKLDYILTFIDFQGSPPPMRGKVDARDVFFHFFRITPAYAGKSVGKSQRIRV